MPFPIGCNEGAILYFPRISQEDGRLHLPQLLQRYEADGADNDMIENLNPEQISATSSQVVYW